MKNIEISFLVFSLTLIFYFILMNKKILLYLIKNINFNKIPNKVKSTFRLLSLILSTIFNHFYLKHLNKNKKAQSANEVLMTYGWAILAVIASLSALYLFNFHEKIIPNTCNVGAGIACEEYKATETGDILIKLRNGTGVNFEDTSISNIEFQSGTCESLCWQPLRDGQTSNYFLNCQNIGAANDVFSAGFSFVYRAVGKVFTHSSEGKITTRIESGNLGENLCDQDFDGLNDNQEHTFGTNPGKEDSDNDQINDSEEINHNWDPLQNQDPTCEDYGSSLNLNNTCYDNSCDQYNNCTSSKGYCSSNKYCCSGSCTQETVLCGGFSQPFCPDVSGPNLIEDGVVDFEDLIYLAIGYGSCHETNPEMFESKWKADFNQDCCIGQIDLNCLNPYYGQQINCTTFTGTCQI